MKLLLVRHGETDRNQVNKIQGKTDIPLNENGKEQAKKLAEELKDKQFDLIISSPLSRAKETAEIINQTFNKPLEIDERLQERNYGEFEGLEKNDSSYQQFREEFWDYHANITYEKAENIRDLYQRVSYLIQDIKEKHKGKNVLLLTHAGICKIIEFYFHPESKKSNKGKLINHSTKNCELIEYTL